MYDIYGKNKITGRFGDKRSYYKPGHFHEGDDIALGLNSPINVIADGTVTRVAFDKNGYGWYADVLHDNGITTRYGHANRYDVKPGDKVKEGQAIGLVGQTGRATGPHIHFEAIQNGKKINPREISKYFVLSDSTVKPKGIINMQNINNVSDAEQIESLKNDIALNQAANKLKTPEEEALQKLTIGLLMSRLQQPEQVPGNLTIQDILNGNDLSKKEFAHGPGIARGLNTLFGTKVFNPRTGATEDLGEKYIYDNERRKELEYQHAEKQQQLQDLLGYKTYSALNGIDENNANNQLRQLLANQNLAYQMQRDAENRAYQDRKAQEQRAWEEEKLDRAEKLKREEIAARYGGEVQTDGTITGGAASVNNGNISNLKMTAADRKQLTENKTTLANIEAGIQSLDENPKAYSLVKGILPADITNRIDPTGVPTRTQIDNITAVYRKWLTGAQMSDKERKAYERFLPAPTDNYNIVKAKLNGMKGAIERSNQALLSNYGVSAEIEPQGNNEIINKLKNDDYVNMKAPNGKIYKVPKEKVNEMEQKGGEII